MASGNIPIMLYAEDFFAKTIKMGENDTITITVVDNTLFFFATNDAIACVRKHPNGTFNEYDPKNIATNVSSAVFKIKFSGEWNQVMILSTRGDYTYTLSHS